MWSLFERILGMRRNKSGKFLAKGADKIVIETRFPVGDCEAHFSDEPETHDFPSCDEPNPDTVVAVAFCQERAGKTIHGLEITWKVKNPTGREIEWHARKSQ